jgi:hypothetical protein
MTYNSRMLLFTISAKYKFKLQYHPSVCHNITISPIFCILLVYNPRWAFQHRPCHSLTETVVPCNVQQSTFHQQPPFSMAIISTLSSNTSLPISYCLKNVRGTSTSSGHNFLQVWYSSIWVPHSAHHSLFWKFRRTIMTVAHETFRTR